MKASSVAGAAVVIPLSAYLWGFTVDDALIPARVASHFLQEGVASFNSGGPATDAVTPLGFAQFMAMLGELGGQSETWALFEIARRAGFLAFLALAALVGRDLGKHWLCPENAVSAESGTPDAPPPRLRSTDGIAAGCAALAMNVPLAAWSGAGLETPWVALLATWALWRQRGADLAAGSAAAWRPELTPWALTLVLVRAWGRGSGEASSTFRRVVRAGAVVASPMVLVAALRWWFFGSLVPNSAVAKPASLPHGLQYLFGTLVFGGPFVLLASRKVATWWPRAGRANERGAVLVALPVGLVSLALAGGDWMPFYRLAVPLIPGVIVIGSLLQRRNLQSMARVALMVASSVVLLVYRGPDARRVVERRQALIEEARPRFASASVVATVDVGWVGVATSARVVDLAGVTDPRIARLPGGHTTKRISPGLLDDRRVDTLVFLVERGAPDDNWHATYFRYGSEARLARGAHDRGFRLDGRLPLAGIPFEYLVLRYQNAP